MKSTTAVALVLGAGAWVAVCWGPVAVKALAAAIAVVAMLIILAEDSR